MLMCYMEKDYSKIKWNRMYTIDYNCIILLPDIFSWNHTRCCRFRGSGPFASNHRSEHATLKATWQRIPNWIIGSILYSFYEYITNIFVRNSWTCWHATNICGTLDKMERRGTMILETCLLERWRCMSQLQVLRTFQTLTTIKCTTDGKEPEKKKSSFSGKNKDKETWKNSNQCSMSRTHTLSPRKILPNS